MAPTMDTIPEGRIVIGEGERDEAPVLYLREQVRAEFGIHVATLS